MAYVAYKRYTNTHRHTSAPTHANVFYPTAHDPVTKAWARRLYDALALNDTSLIEMGRCVNASFLSAVNKWASEQACGAAFGYCVASYCASKRERNMSTHSNGSGKNEQNNTVHIPFCLAARISILVACMCLCSLILPEFGSSKRQHNDEREISSRKKELENKRQCKPKQANK